MTEKYDAVVVGAGPAGLAAAMELAKNGSQVLVLERGKAAGAKNATGGILYGQTNTPYNLDHLIPGFEKEAPIERPIHDYLMHCVAGDKVKSLDITPLHLHEHKWSYAVLRGPFDRWFADKVHDAARKHGGGVLTDVHVKGPLMDGNEIVGVETEELDPIMANVVIAADGATSEMVRKAGLRGWNDAHDWFQGVKVVVKLPDAKAVEDRFGLAPGQGSAHMFAGDLFDGARGGGFVYTNKDTLSIGTVFHLDSLADTKVEPHALLDRLLLHSKVQKWLGADAKELEYSAKLIPDGKKMALKRPYSGRLLAIGDAAGQMQAQGPVIKGMNLGITAGILAAQSYLEAKRDGRLQFVGPMYERALKRSYLKSALRPWSYRISRLLAENEFMDDILGWTVDNALSRRILRSDKGVASVTRMMSSPRLAAANPDIAFGYVKLPTMMASLTGTSTNGNPAVWQPRSLADRIAALSYDTAIGSPHIVLKDASPDASGKAVHTCPVSARGFSGGCYRLETVKDSGGHETEVVALDTQPCVECGTCAIMASTKWDHPKGGKGVVFKLG